MGPLPLRTATVDDAAALDRLVNSAYRGDSSRSGWTTEADLLGGQRTDAEGLRELLSKPDSVVLLHERGDAPIACVHLQRTARGCYLGMLTIEPTLQSAGLGRAMLDAAEAFARREWHSPLMYMTVIIQRDALIAWYERRGYRRSGERRPFPYGDERFGLPLRPDLEFEILVKPLT